MDISEKSSRCRVVGDYVIGPKIGSGSFAVVWRSKHRHLGTEFAIKEIDKKHLNDSLLKEIEILRNISHPNIIRLFEAIETEKRIYLVLEYCDGGDLGAYIHRHGRVSEGVARHFLKQLAAGLQVLRENHLIHRDLKPQNLLLYGKEMTPMLKIGDFGFARYLTPQGLADTLCGSPLYMAPEIIQNQKYDAKADLWSVGAILYQLVIGKPPFDGNNQLQLFQNILRSTELRFPEGALRVLDPNFVELCRCLLRRNPVERLTFEEFFNHKFMKDSRVAVDTESSLISQVETFVLTDDQSPQLQQEDELKPLEGSGKHCLSVNDEQGDLRKDCYRTPSGKDVGLVIPNISGKITRSFEDSPFSSSQNRVADSLDSIEREYVLVHSNFASMEIFTSSLGASSKESSAAQPCTLATKTSDQQKTISVETKEETPNCVGGTEYISKSRTVSSSTWYSPCMIREARGLTVLHPLTRLQLLHQYLGALSDLAQEKLNAGSFLESFSVELVVLALWKEAFRICSSWLSSREGGNLLPECPTGSDLASATASSSSQEQGAPDFSNPSFVFIWAEKGFILACERTEKLSKHFQDVDDAAQMPDAIEIMYQSALTAGRNGAADELIGNRDSAATMYSKALLLFSFIVAEAPSLPLNPPFFLAEENKQRILKYIKSLESHLNNSLMSQPPQLPSFLTK